MSAPIPIVVLGAAGRVGRANVAAAAADPQVRLVGAIESPGHPELGKDAGALAGLAPLGVGLGAELGPLLAGRPVVIDFTTPQATLAALTACAQAGAPMVIGTTGLSADDKARVAALAAKVPVVMAPNMSVGVNLLFYLVEQAARIAGESFDLEIIEAHHRMKQDAPSGTALRLAEIAAAARGWDLADVANYHRQGAIGRRPDREIGVQTVRAGDIVGEHTVLIAGPGERLELIHRAHGREVFAKGAIRAAKWIAEKSAGLYDMQDVLGVKGT